MNFAAVILSGCGIAVAGYFALRRFESMANKTTDELRAILRGSEFLFYRNALFELRKRGEDIREEVVQILHLLISDNKQQRYLGWHILREIYPDLAARVADYKPQESQDMCKEKMQKIFLTMANNTLHATAAAPGS